MLTVNPKGEADREDEIDGDRKTEISSELTDRAAMIRNRGYRRDFVFHGRLLIKHGEVDCVEVDGLRAAEVLMLLDVEVETFPCEVFTYPAMVKLRSETTPIVPVTVDVPCRFSVTTGEGASQSIFHEGSRNLRRSLVEEQQQGRRLSEITVVVEQAQGDRVRIAVTQQAGKRSEIHAIRDEVEGLNSRRRHPLVRQEIRCRPRGNWERCRPADRRW